MADRIPVLLDTDPGSDIDDAVAIAYLLRQPRCEFLGITTVTGDVAKRSAIADVVCRAAGRSDVPIHSGASDVLIYGPGQPHVPQYDAIQDLPHRKDWPKNTAVDFLRETIRSRPGEITLLTVGPLTNAALLFAIDPEIPSLLKQVVTMGGFFYDAGSSEWNCRVDPIATAMFYKARPARHLSIGLDVTRKCTMTPGQVAERFVAPELEVCKKMSDVWFKGSKQLTFHDPLAAAVIFRPELCHYERGTVRIELSTDQNRGGFTHFEPGAQGPQEVAKQVNSEAFFEEYFSVFG